MPVEGSPVSVNENGQQTSVTIDLANLSPDARRNADDAISYFVYLLHCTISPDHLERHKASMAIQLGKTAMREIQDFSETGSGNGEASRTSEKPG